MRLMRWMSLLFMLAWMGVIFFLSHQSGSASAQLSGSFSQVLIQCFAFLGLDLDFFHIIIRKSAHFFAYFLLGILALLHIQTYQALKSYSYGLAWILAVMYAVTDEYHQTFIPGRSGQWLDVVIDSLGALTGLLLFKGFTRRCGSIFQILRNKI